MFGYKRFRVADVNAMKEKIEGLQSELKSANANSGLNVITLSGDSAFQSLVASVDRGKIKKVYESCGPAYGIINKIAGAVGEVSRYLDLYEVSTGRIVEMGDGRRNPAAWLLTLLRQPNRREDIKRFATGWAVNRLCYGDAWIWSPSQVGKDYGTSKAMKVIPSWKVDPGRPENAFDTFREIRIAGTTSALPAEEFIESFNYNLDDTSYFGTSPLVVAAVYLSIMDDAMQRQDTSLKNGGPSAIVSPKPDQMGVLPQTADRLTEDLNGKEVKGQIKAVRTALEVHQLGVSPVDLGILNAHDKAVNVLCFMYDIPVDLYLGQAKYENSKEAKMSLYEQNAIPLAEELGADLLLHFGLADKYEFRVNRDRIDVLQRSPKDVLDNLNAMHATLNEMRESYGYDPRPEPWADLPIFNLGVMFGNEAYDINEI